MSTTPVNRPTQDHPLGSPSETIVLIQHTVTVHSSAIDINSNNNNNNNNNSHDNVYGAVIMTKVIARVHPVHLMNAD